MEACQTGLESAVGAQYISMPACNIKESQAHFMVPMLFQHLLYLTCEKCISTTIQ
jgi:hypothetical protein